MGDHVPKILMIGAGRFGRNHIELWSQIAATKAVELIGLVVATESSRRALEEEFRVPAFRALDDRLMEQADGIDIATPSATHADLVRRCLHHAHVMVEKPVAASAREAEILHALAQSLNRILMVGHVYRFHPVLHKLKEIVTHRPGYPHAIEATLVNPLEPGVEQVDANLEILHPFDMIDYLFDRIPEVLLGRRRHSTNRVSLRYPGPINASIKIGWEGNTPHRILKLFYDDLWIRADFIFNTIEIHKRDYQVDKLIFPHRHEALKNELHHFVSLITGDETQYPDAALGARVVDIAVRSRPRIEKHRPSVAIIGGGIFGATVALELGSFCDVTLFERRNEMLAEASYVNQWRHHSGFHYPRSYDTIQEIKASRETFEAEYGEAIMRDIPAYFAVAAKAVEIPRERYLAACSGNNLNFSIESPPLHILDPMKVSVCILTDEGVYNYEKLKSLVLRRLGQCSGVRICLGTEVTYGAIDADGHKRMTIKGDNGTRQESFDYLINATYQNRNLVGKWFRFPVEPLRFDQIELLLIEADGPQVCATVIDAPFVSVIGTGTPNQYLLSHRFDMILRSVITADGMPPRWPDWPTNRESILRHAVGYFPFLRNAKVLESRYGVRAVNAYAADVDARPTVVTEHGFGCWSILGGKIITCVSNAREIAGQILAEREESSVAPGVLLVP